MTANATDVLLTRSIHSFPSSPTQPTRVPISSSRGRRQPWCFVCSSLGLLPTALPYAEAGFLTWLRHHNRTSKKAIAALTSDDISREAILLT